MSAHVPRHIQQQHHCQPAEVQIRYWSENYRFSHTPSNSHTGPPQTKAKQNKMTTVGTISQRTHGTMSKLYCIVASLNSYPKSIRGSSTWVSWQRWRHAGGGWEQSQSTQVKSRDQMCLLLHKRQLHVRDDSTLYAHYYYYYYNIPIESHTICTLQTFVQAYIHGSDVILIGFSDFLHDLRFSLTTAINDSFDGDGSLLVVQWQVLETAHTGARRVLKGESKPFQKEKWVS